MKLIGRGTFTKAYLMDNGKVFLKSSDYIKECMAMGWFGSSRLFPKVEHGDERDTYTMTYYPKVKSLKNSLTPNDYKLYKELRKLFLLLTQPCNHNLLYDKFKTIKNRRARRALLEALGGCSNYGSDVCFEISPRNVAVSKAGRLVLLDCFFMKSQLNEARSRWNDKR